MSIAFQVPISFALGTSLSESSVIGFLAQVPSAKAGFALQKHCKVSSSSDRRLCTFVVVGGKKSIRKALHMLDGFLRN